MKKIMLAAAALALTAGMGMAQTVRIATEGAYPPYNLVNDKGEVDGFEVELGNELCKRAELQCTWVKNDWDSIIPNLNSGNYDAIMAGMSITEERKKSVAFSQNYYPPNPSAYAAPQADVDVTKGVVAAQTSTIQAQYVAESGAELLEFATPTKPWARCATARPRRYSPTRTSWPRWSMNRTAPWSGSPARTRSGWATASAWRCASPTRPCRTSSTPPSTR